jgi:LAO/AO transport system kinase
MPSLVNTLIEQVRGGRRRSIGQLITRVENGDVAAKEVLRELYRDTGRAHVVGVTGPPGTGKSTLVNEIAKTLRRQKKSVAIVAVDPSSPFSGGALLGDRIRMRDLSGDEGVFIRSMATRGSLGGLARATSDVVGILDAAAFDVIIVETVGAGQAEVDIARAAHTVIVIESPGMGDEIQTIKAGILETADILVVNKADRPGADRTVKALRAMLQMGASSGPLRHHGQIMATSANPDGAESAQPGWIPSVYETIATEGKGVEAVVETVRSHMSYLNSSGELAKRELAQSRRKIDAMLQEAFTARLNNAVEPTEMERIVAAVAERRLDPYSAVEQLLNGVPM